MNFATETFEQFSSRLGPTDLALYAGGALILWVLFKEKLGSLYSSDSIQKLKNLFMAKPSSSPSKPQTVVVSETVTSKENSDDIFFQLVTSWKQTRDLAVKSGCTEAIKVADQMFPFLSPTVCSKKENV